MRAHMFKGQACTAHSGEVSSNLGLHVIGAIQQARSAQRTTMATARLLLLPLLWLLAPTIVDAASTRYGYSMTLDTSDSRLVHLATYTIGPGGNFMIALDVTLTIEIPGADHGRNMLHLIVCDTDAVNKFTHLSAAGPSAPVSGSTSAVCAMGNQTLFNLCQSYPLRDESKGKSIYRSQGTYSGIWQDGPEFTTETVGGASDGKLSFFIDACETAGGADGVLRSCLQQEDSRALGSSDCFWCPKYVATDSHSSTIPENKSTCNIPEQIRPIMHIQASMNLCNKEDACLSSGKRFLTTFYLGLTISWAVTWLVWTAHIRASREAVVSLQTKMRLVPAVLCLYAGLTCTMLYMDDILVGTARKLVVNLALLSQMFALAVPAEVVILVAKGWKITRAQLDLREYQYIRFVTLVWAISYTVLKNSMVKHLAIFLVWGVSWSSVVFMIWYNSAFNLNMLLYQIAMVRQMQLDATRTPVYTKYMLFRRFRGMLGIYMFISCVIAVLGLVSDTTNDRWRWSATAADEALSFCLYAAVGYNFRCRRFSNLIQAPASTGSADIAAAANNSWGPTSAQASSASVAPTGPQTRLADVVHAKSSIVLVMNPNPSEQSLGTSYLPINPKAGKPDASEASVAPGSSSPTKATN